MEGFGGSTGVSKGYVDRAIAQSTAIVERVTIPQFTVNASSAYSLNLQYTKQGYTCWFLNYFEYRSSATWYIHIKDIKPNDVTIDVVNTGGSAMSPNAAYAVWLCIPTS